MTPQKTFPLPPLAVIGCGLGRPCLTPAAAACLDAAAVVVGGKRLLAAFPDHPGRRIPISGPLAGILDAIEAARQAGQSVAVLADGDGLYFGIGATLLARFGREALAFYPNVTTVALACSRLGRPWHAVTAVSLHGRTDMTPLFAALARQGAVAVYTDATNTPAAIAARVLSRGGDGFTMTICEDLDLPDERIRQLPLAEAVTASASALTLVILDRTTPPAVPLHLGLPDDALLRHDAVFTKAPVRAVSLAALAVRPGEVVWDIGAGTGSVALEASLLNTGGPVLALERDPKRHALLIANIQRTGALTVTPLCAEAPDGLEALPDPHRIFVGGGLSSRPELLPTLCRRLLPGGRLVINAVLLGSLTGAMATLTTLGLPFALTQLQAGQSSPLANDLRLAADNPVFIITASKEPAHA
ncbi:precorrin-6y C5,15-methyltransferase (decarboxylating) subunit CbiE [Desulfovibrio aerotolerans]|uniref:Precorrin-6y C5,15-methyltransferase (Decarboxylating) subunit CbiE n=1 Tax=Solidesulfovibrio aerotolerans TaxID=295255 RepID=A0A7C9ISN9_9BACT|nr:precorrin-6y C5,15-methyltransferase (decarboxylating) subunit CbiE [Solidesulfovibrio aerotolerans]MYL81640.1 precorrin-6y C5,15-methyltransferase (decarboxylating) subunit CbiE [Solidesulfovibrio aerotolerans]